jgi:hypothetical protein
MYEISFRYDIQLLRPVTGSAARCLDVRPIVRAGAAVRAHVRGEPCDASPRIHMFGHSFADMCRFRDDGQEPNGAPVHGRCPPYCRGRAHAARVNAASLQASERLWLSQTGSLATRFASQAPAQSDIEALCARASILRCTGCFSGDSPATACPALVHASQSCLNLSSRRTDRVLALMHLTLSMFAHDAVDAQPLGSSIGACAFTVPLLHFPSSIYPEFIAFHIPPAAVAAAMATSHQHTLDCVYDITQDDRAPPIFICTALRSPARAEQLLIPASLLAASAAHAMGLSLEAPADAALHLLDQGDGVLDKLSSLQLNLWLVNGLYPPSVQQLLLLIAATHYLVHAAAVTDNALVDCSAAAASATTHLPPICMHLIYIHKRFVAPVPSRYSHIILPFGRTNYSADVESAGGHYFATLLNRQRPWAHIIPEQTFGDSPSNETKQWWQRVLQLQQRRSPGHAHHGAHKSVENMNLGLTAMPAEEELVLDRCSSAERCLPFVHVLSAAGAPTAVMRRRGALLLSWGFTGARPTSTACFKRSWTAVQRYHALSSRLMAARLQNNFGR